MRILLQRVSSASVSVEDKVVGQIHRGLLAFVGFAHADGEAELDQMVKKTLQLRIFEDEQGKMNLSLQDLGLHILVVSQFTLYGDTRKGNRPSFVQAAEPVKAEQLYDRFVEKLRSAVGKERVATGIFRATMEVALVNDGPVTLLLEAESASGR